MRVDGRQACVESYREFMEQATIQRCEEGTPVVDVWGDIAVATYRWSMAWTAEGVLNQDAGHDILVLRRDEFGGAAVWRVVWRAITSEGKR